MTDTYIEFHVPTLFLKSNAGTTKVNTAWQDELQYSYCE